MFMALVHCVLSCANQILNLCHSNHIKGAGGQGYSCYGYLGFIIGSNEVCHDARVWKGSHAVKGRKYYPFLDYGG